MASGTLVEMEIFKVKTCLEDGHDLVLMGLEGWGLAGPSAKGWTVKESRGYIWGITATSGCTKTQ